MDMPITLIVVYIYPDIKLFILNIYSFLFVNYT